jgi:hypothetical protein
VPVHRAGAVDGIVHAVSGAEYTERQDNDNGNEPKDGFINAFSAQDF